MPRLQLTPPLINSACPWATTLEDLTALYYCPHTGAVTTRTSLLRPFPHSSHIHQHHIAASSHNTYGYSPHPLEYYLTSIRTLLASSGAAQQKPFIISITGTAAEIAEGVNQITELVAGGVKCWIELNLSCPNIPGAPPPAYDAAALKEYIALLPETTVPMGVKVPPYTYEAQFAGLVETLRTRKQGWAFVTAVNTLGGCLLLDSPPSLGVGERRVWQPRLSSADGTGIGGMGGEGLHTLALGNVARLRWLLDEGGLEETIVIGVGGVEDAEGMERMLAVGAEVVGCATALGREGVSVFGMILKCPEDEDSDEIVEVTKMGVTMPPV